MEVTLLNATPINIANIAASCSIGRVNNPSPTSLINAVKAGHLSVLEHIYFTFLITNISRSCSHQLVRHRIASYTQSSQRYCKISTQTQWNTIPKSIEDNSAAKEIYDKVIGIISAGYNKLIDGGIPKEDARFVLPNACMTDIVISMNARAFIEASQKRICKKAQWEIQELFTKMVEILKQTNIDDYSIVYNLCTPNCLRIGCQEAHPCVKK